MHVDQARQAQAPPEVGHARGRGRPVGHARLSAVRAASTVSSTGITEASPELAKAHLQVGGYDPNDPLLAPVWGALAEAGTPAGVHCGNGPRRGPHTGIGPMEAVLRRFPGLVLVVAHAGLPDYLDFAALADRWPLVHLDTTMVGTEFTEQMAPMPAGYRSRLADLAGRVVLGTDFPTIPYPYRTQLDALAGLDLGDAWLRGVCWHNGIRLLGLGPDGSARGG